MRALALLAALGVAGAAEPLLTDLRLVAGTNQREYSIDGHDDRFTSGGTVEAQFIYGFSPLNQDGTWFVGGAARFASAKDTDDSDHLTGRWRRFSALALGGYAIAPLEDGMLHVELGPYAGLGLATAAFTEGAAGTDVTEDHSDTAPVLEGGLRLGAYLTWNDAIQLGLEGSYGLVLSRVEATGGGAKTLANQGFSAAIGVGVRLH